MNPYLTALIKASADIRPIIEEALVELRARPFDRKVSENNPSLSMLTQGEIIEYSWVTDAEDPEARIRTKLFYSAIANAVVERTITDIRRLYGDIQAHWVDNSEEVVEKFMEFVESFTYGDMSHHLRDMSDVEESELENKLTDFDNSYFVEISHFLKLGTEGPVWGEFRASAGRWKKDQETGLLHREILKDWPEMDN